MNIAENINIILKEQNLQQKELANYLGIAPSTLNGWLKLGRSIPSEYLIRISEFLKVSTDYLLGNTNEPNSVTQVNTGDVGNHSNVNVNNSNKTELDEMSQELLNKFKELPFDEKIEVFNYIKSRKGA